MKAFISYSHRDKAMLDRLHTHLAMLRRDGTITAWYDRMIVAGGNIEREIDKELDGCELFLALVSPDFLSSGYCYDKEMTRAMERHAAGEIAIVPIILEPCDWLASPLKQFKVIPKDGTPVSDWTNKNAAWLDVISELRRLLQAIGSEGGSTIEHDSRAESRRTSPAKSKYRVKETFDQIDRDDFRRQVFAKFRDFFEQSCKEIDGIDGLRGRYETIGPTAFTCTVVNRLIKAGRGTAHITVRSGGDSVLGGISWSFQANARDNTANGGFNVESDEYHLFLRGSFFSGGDERREWTPEEAANRVWQDFIEQAGITQ